MLNLPGISPLSLLYESANSLVYRGIRDADSQPLILKLLKEDYPTPQELARYRTEYEITRSLDFSGVVRVYDLQKYQNTLVMFVEDFGGESLTIWMQQRSFSLEEFLKIAIATTEALGQIHAANIIHKDINPSNIVFNPETEQLKIIDFGISTKLTRENPTLKNPNILEGTLAYMSPEQTGRMNRTLDYRTDFYSLGITFYELLTGQLPFETTDPLELVHCHIARQPLSPFERNEKIPKVLSDIIMKLMAKTAEDRYQSAYGIKADLENCLNQLQSIHKILNFPIALQDLSDKFQLPQKLYGREQEIETLLNAFERVNSQSELMLIAGYSGIGKTALVQEIYKPMTQKRGYFIAGKFDQYQRNIPYSAIISAFQSLVKQLLTETETQFKEWREKLLTALGINGKVIVDVIPEIELIIGQQPAIPELGATESQNRFNLVFQNFIKVFTQPEHPLAMFLDDLQWADGASLKLMQLLMSSSSPGLFVIGAYRDNEVSTAHPLMLTLDEILKAGAIINRIFLSPLELSTVTQILCETLKTESEIVKPLADLILSKTGGNPFFMNEFLKALYSEKLLEFDFKTGCWNWSLEQIQTRGFTDNVVELMALKIQKLPENTQRMLQLAACIGNQFELSLLGTTCDKTIPETVNDLQIAVSENFVIYLDIFGKILLATNGEISNTQSLRYKFVHDRIQQAAYSLIPEKDKANIHYKIGKLLLKNTSKTKREEKIFDIVNQLNLGINAIAKEVSNLNLQKEKDELARLNLIAGKKAKASVAYESALTYLLVSMALLGEKSWQRQYQLTLRLYEEAAEAAYLSGDFEQMERFSEIVLQQAKNVLDKVKIIEVKIQALTAQTQLEQALDTGIEFVKQLGVRLPKNPNTINILIELLKTQLVLAGKRIEDLANLPQMSHPYKLAALSILSKLMSSAYIAAPKKLPIIVFKQVVLSVKYGNSPESIYAYATYGLILCGLVGNIETGYKFGQLALLVLACFRDNKKFKAKALLVVNDFINHWKRAAKELLVPLLEAYKAGLETGDLEFAAYAATVYCYFSFMIGKELSDLELQFAAYGKAIAQLKQEQVVRMHKPIHQTVINLLDRVVNPCYLIGSAYDEETLLPLSLKANDYNSLFLIYFNKMFLCYLFCEYSEAILNANHTKQYLEHATGLLFIPSFHFYDSLAHLALFSNVSKLEKKRYYTKIKVNQKKLYKWANHAPRNHLHKYFLVEAERYRVRGQDTLAMDYYDRSISIAKENEYINEAAIAYELAAQFYLSKGKELTGKAYMQEARYCYQLWGAVAKVKDLEKRYPQLFTTSQLTIKNTSPRTTNSGSNLDIVTVMKASQAISGEIELEKLLSSLMKILIENAGAQRGHLIVPRQGKLWIEAEGNIESEEIRILPSISVEDCQIISESIINYVLRTQESVVLNDATQDGQFSNDSYIKNHQPKSILCVPLINQGKLVSIVYLENNLTTGAFTAERQELLNLLSAQAAISLENAQLYKNMAELNRAYERFVPSQFLQFLEKSSIIDVQLGDQVQVEMSVLFSDIRDFTTLSETMTPEENFKFINAYLSRMEPAILENSGFIDKYIGDAIMALFSGKADNSVKAGISMLQRLLQYNQNRVKSGYKPIQNGIGINTGSLMLGTVGGQNRMDSTVISDAVNLASRIEGLTKNYGVSLLISESTFARLQEPESYAIREIDTVQVKGKSQRVTVYEVFDADPIFLKESKLKTLPLFNAALSLYRLNELSGAAELFARCLVETPDDKVAQIYLQRCEQTIQQS